MSLEWLPNLNLLADYDGNWDAYLEATYAIFQNDFLGVRPSVFGKTMGLKRQPISEGKEATFWHFVSYGSVEADREIDFRRCERIGWPRAIIDNINDPRLKIWNEQQTRDIRIHIWCEEDDYLFVMADRSDYVLPWTAFDLRHAHARVKYQRRWERNKDA